MSRLKKMSFIMVFALIMSMSLLACSNGNTESKSESKSSFFDENRIEGDYAEYSGEYQDSFSERASMSAEDLGDEVFYIDESIDIDNLPDGTYPVKIFFDRMKRNEDSTSLDFMIYTVIHYDPEDIRNLKSGDIIYEYVDETTTENYLIDTVNFPLDEVCVINGGSERGDGLTLSLDKSGLFRVSVDEIYTRNASQGIARMEIPDSVVFSDNYDLEESSLNGDKLYEYFNSLSDNEKEYFNQNNTFITISGGKVTEFQRIYLP